MRIPASLVFFALLVACGAIAGPPATPTRPEAPPMPAWDQLSRAQQELLLGPVRDRWNDSPQRRARMYDHAERWQHMTPDQRNRAHRGVRRWEHMDPHQRTQARALYERMKTMTPEQRRALHDRWKAMTPAQRDAWIEQRRED